VYDTTLTERINWALRLPILIINGLLIILSFYLLKKIFPQSPLPILTTLFIALTPALIGISQIINPDALLWSCSLISFLAVIAFLRTTHWTYILLAGIFIGLALLSKYTANVLFPLILSLLFTYPLWNEAWKDKFFSLKNYLQVTVKTFATLLLLAHITFALGMPAVFQKPEKLFDGIFGFWHNMHIDWLLIIPLLLITLDGFFLQGRYSAKLIRLTAFWKPTILSSLRWSLLIPLLFFGSLFFLSLG
ncbi:phospholipid carrier-dependent glycosyltransferase, partial [Candidatus Dojkabacteria bacterium]